MVAKAVFGVLVWAIAANKSGKEDQIIDDLASQIGDAEQSLKALRQQRDLVAPRED